MDWVHSKLLKIISAYGKRWFIRPCLLAAIQTRSI